MKKLVVILLLIVVLVVALNFDGVKCADISQQCLNCICQASTGCNLKTKCQNAGENSYFCGPYLISWAYWADGGKPGNTGNSQDFEKCLTNKKCAEVAIRGYMTKWQKDCNNDGVIDCLDYAAIHKAGASGCNQQWLFNSKYWNQFRQCHIGSYGSDSYADTANDEQPQYNPAIQPRPQSQPSEYPSQPSEYQPQPNEYQPQPNAYQPDEYQPESNGYQPQPQPQPQPQFQPSGSGYRPQPSEYQPQPSQPNEYRPRPQPQPNVYRPQPTEYRPQPQPIGGNVPGRATVIGVSWSTSTSTSDNNYKPDSYESYDTYNPNVRPQRPAVQNQPSSPSQNQPEVVDYSTYREPLPANNDNVEPDYTGVLNPNPAPAPAPALEPSDTYTVSGPVGESCLECICQASTDCDLAKQCEGNFCGAYLLSWGYWADGGKPGGDYATCANNKACAERAVQGYMNKWQKDCNNDGKIDCTDFAAIHKLGPHSCGSDSLYGTKYWISYESCNAPPIDARRSPSSHSARSISSVPSVANNNNNDFISFHYTLPPNSIPEDTNYRSQPNLQPSPPRNSQPTQSRPQPQPQYEPQPQHQPQPQPQPQYQPPTQPPPPLQPRYESQPQPPPVVERMSYPASNSYFNNPVLPNNDRQPPQPQPQPQPPRQPPSEPNLSNSYIGITPNSDARYARNASSNRDNSEEVPRDCMDCICQASSKCNANIGCQNDGLGGFICGAYQMNWAYWSDAGKPSLNGNNLQNFQMCLNDKDCAEATVYGYMSKWKRDCNDDKQLDCFDYAAIHKAGPSNCNAQWFLESQYWSDFRECFDFRRK